MEQILDAIAGFLGLLLVIPVALVALPVFLFAIGWLVPPVWILFWAVLDFYGWVFKKLLGD